MCKCVFVFVYVYVFVSLVVFPTCNLIMNRKREKWGTFEAEQLLQFSTLSKFSTSVFGTIF